LPPHVVLPSVAAVVAQRLGEGLPAAGLMARPVMGQHMPVMGQPAVEVRFRGPSMRATVKTNYKT